MLHRIRRHRPSPPMVVALVALMVALGGSSYAAIALPKNSVGASQIKQNAVTGAKVKDRTLRAADFAAGQLPAGPGGPMGPAGPAGPAGSPGEKGDRGGAVIPAPAAWTALPLGGGIAAYGSGYKPPEYRKDALGVVHLRGVLTDVQGTPQVNDILATLPTGFRPAARSLFPVVTGTPTGAGSVSISATDGTVRLLSGSMTAVSFLDLSAVSFATD